MNELLEQVKTNLQINFNDDALIVATTSCATKYQHLP